MQEKSSGKAKSDKKAYSKPEVWFEKVFETMALACSKHNTNQCATGKAS